MIQHNEPLTAGHIVKAYALLAVLPFSKATDPQLIAALLSAYRAAELSGTELLEAAAWAAQTQTAWPAPAVLIQRVRDSRERATHGTIETAEEAWGQVLSTMQGGVPSRWDGYGLPPTLSPRCAGAFLAAFGPSWSAFWGSALSSDMVSHRSRFIDAYRSSSALDKQLLAHEQRKRHDSNPALAGLWQPRIPYAQQKPEWDDLVPGEFDDSM